jgi:hypothetical protein
MSNSNDLRYIDTVCHEFSVNYSNTASSTFPNVQKNEYHESNARTLRYLYAGGPNQQDHLQRHRHRPSSRLYRLIVLPSSPVIYSPLLPLVRSPLSYPINTTAPRPQHHFCTIRSVVEEKDLHWRKVIFGRSRDWGNFELRYV